MRRMPVLAAGGLAAMTATAVALAAAGAPTSREVAADVVFDHVKGKTRVCEGAGGQGHFEQHVQAEGEVTGDPALTGRLTIKLYNQGSFDGLAQEQGTFRIRDAAGRWIAQGRYAHAGIDEFGQGLMVGETRDPDEPGAGRGRLYAGLRITFNPDFSVTAQIGGDLPDGRLPATILTGSCRGPYEAFESDIPAPAAAGAARRATVRGWSR